MCATWSRSIQRTFEDLTSLEVNTIIKTTINSGKVDDRDFLMLYQLAGAYYAKITELGKKYERLIPADFSEPDLKIQRIRDNNFFMREHLFVTGGVFSFRELGIWARFGSGFINSYGDQLSNTPTERAEDLNMLNRIDGICGTFSQILETEVEEVNLKKKEVTGKHRLEGGETEGKKKVIDVLWNTYKSLHDEYGADWKNHINEELGKVEGDISASGEKTFEVMNVYYPLVRPENRPDAIGGGE
ncbi:MAG TPA: hypothetical protein DCE41_04220, partial [Cytophagales bacterium]|nr:hypothetical protein [Cytophagales bacterium]